MIKKKNKIKQRLLYFGYILVIFVAAMEIILRIYNPFPQKINGDRWEMSTNTSYRFTNDFNSRLDSVIINKENSLGFRGENPPANINNYFSVLTIGGSTTACTFLSEGKTWTDLLGNKIKNQYSQFWINNAGIDGHSSYGHLNFMYYYLPKISVSPKLALFLIGANDVDRSDLSHIDSTLNNRLSYKIKKWFFTHSETVIFFRNLKHVLFPENIFRDKENWNFKNFEAVHLSNNYIDSALKAQTDILNSYKQRLNQIISLCAKSKIQPVFITQPTVFGNGTAEGGNPAIDFHVFHTHENGQLFWLKLQLYNNITKQVAKDNKIFCIDLASEMPKDTLYYYDIVHYTNAGAQKVADIIFDDLKDYLAREYYQFEKK